jgi:hypothetical protein
VAEFGLDFPEVHWPFYHIEIIVDTVLVRVDRPVKEVASFGLPADIHYFEGRFLPSWFQQ